MKKPGAVSRPGVMHRSSYVLLDDGLLYEIRVTPVYGNRQPTSNFWPKRCCARSGAHRPRCRRVTSISACFAFWFWQLRPQRASTFCQTGTAPASACGAPRPAWFFDPSWTRTPRSTCGTHPPSTFQVTNSCAFDMDIDTLLVTRLSCLRAPEFSCRRAPGACANKTWVLPISRGAGQSRLARHCLALRSCDAVIPLARATAFAAVKPIWLT